ncbi:MAG: hypothetical protein QM743_06165 [Chitinophagaceae bacterium]
MSDNVLSFGIGTGLEFGATIGARLAIFPERHIGCTLGTGITLSMLTYNLGIKLRPFPEFIFSPFFDALYGHNYVIDTKDYRYGDGNITSRGISVGGGFDINLTRSQTVYLTLGADYAIDPAVAYVKGGISVVLGR